MAFFSSKLENLRRLWSAPRRLDVGSPLGAQSNSCLLKRLMKLKRLRELKNQPLRWSTFVFQGNHHGPLIHTCVWYEIERLTCSITLYSLACQSFCTKSARLSWHWKQTPTEEALLLGSAILLLFCRCALRSSIWPKPSNVPCLQDLSTRYLFCVQNKSGQKECCCDKLTSDLNLVLCRSFNLSKTNISKGSRKKADVYIREHVLKRKWQGFSAMLLPCKKVIFPLEIQLGTSVCPRLFFGEEILMAVRFYTHGWVRGPQKEARIENRASGVNHMRGWKFRQV